MRGYTEVGFIHLTTDDGKRVHTQISACSRCGALVSAMSLDDHERWHDGPPPDAYAGPM